MTGVAISPARERRRVPGAGPSAGEGLRSVATGSNYVLSGVETVQNLKTDKVYWYVLVEYQCWICF